MTHTFNWNCIWTYCFCFIPDHYSVRSVNSGGKWHNEPVPVVYTYNSSYLRGWDWKDHDWRLACTNSLRSPNSKMIRAKWIQVVECLLCKHEALSLKPSLSLFLSLSLSHTHTHTHTHIKARCTKDHRLDFFRTGGWTSALHILEGTAQALYHLSHSPRHFCFCLHYYYLFWDGLTVFMWTVLELTIFLSLPPE
jgi:hypothetical protein